MTAAAPEPERAWAGLADPARSQAGAVTWQQVVTLTGDRANARRHVRAGRWQVLLPGVYATFTGPVPTRTWWWAVLLHAGRGAAFGGEAALWLEGLRDAPPQLLEICVPHGRQVVPPPGVVVRSRCDLDRLVRPLRTPPRLRIEEAVLDVAGAATRPAAVVDVVLAAVQRRLTTPDRLAAALGLRARHRWRALVVELTAAGAEGVHSALERRYLQRVERPHGLPRADRNVRAPGDGAARYPDVRHRRFRLVVELDGERYHPPERSFADRARDNRTVQDGDVVLRYGWREVTDAPCAVAVQVAEVLARQGWTGRPRPCGAGCPLGRPPGAAIGRAVR